MKFATGGNAPEQARDTGPEPWLLANETSVTAAYEHGFDEGRASARGPLTTWRGLCGHLWDRAVEDTDDCPRCAALSQGAAHEERGLDVGWICPNPSMHYARLANEEKG